MPSLSDEEWRDVRESIGGHLADRLAPIHDPSEYTNLSTIPPTKLDIEALVMLRLEHQTEQASSGIRHDPRQTEKEASDPTRKVKRLLLERYKDILRDRDEVGISTGSDHAQRWRYAAPGGRDVIVDNAQSKAPTAGTAANAADAAKARAGEVRPVPVHHLCSPVETDFTCLCGSFFSDRTEARTNRQDIHPTVFCGHGGNLRVSASRRIRRTQRSQ